MTIFFLLLATSTTTTGLLTMRIGAIFDWDGVIIDSSCYHEESWERLAYEEKKPLPPDHFKKGFGMKNELIIPRILGWTADSLEVERLSLRKELLYRKIMQEKGIAPLPGVREFLQRLKKSDVPCAVGSSTHKENIAQVLKMLDFEGFFKAVISSEDVNRGKPHPQVFLKAAERIRRNPERCVVFEDAHVGIEAARAGKMKVVAIATTHPAFELSEADRVVYRMDELMVRDLKEIVEN